MTQFHLAIYPGTCACSGRDVQRRRSHREVSAPRATIQADVPEARVGRGAVALPAHPRVLLRREARRPRLHDLPDGRAGAEQRLPHRVRPRRVAQRI